MIDEEGNKEIYESKLHKRVWYFLKVLHKGQNLSLYRSPQFKYSKGTAFEGYRILKQPSAEKWLEFTEKKKLFRIYSVSYKRKLKRHLVNCPSLQDNIGKIGFKFEDLLSIVKQYNEQCTKPTKRI